MKIPKRPNFTKKPYSTESEVREWDDFVTLTIATISLAVSIILYFLK